MLYLAMQRIDTRFLVEVQSWCFAPLALLNPGGFTTYQLQLHQQQHCSCSCNCGRWYYRPHPHPLLTAHSCGFIYSSRLWFNLSPFPILSLHSFLIDFASSWLWIGFCHIPLFGLLSFVIVTFITNWLVNLFVSSFVFRETVIINQSTFHIHSSSKQPLCFLHLQTTNRKLHQRYSNLALYVWTLVTVALLPFLSPWLTVSIQKNWKSQNE